MGGPASIATAVLSAWSDFNLLTGIASLADGGIRQILIAARGRLVDAARPLQIKAPSDGRLSCAGGAVARHGGHP